MGSKPKAAAAPPPSTVAVGVTDQAKRQSELNKKRKGGFFRGFRGNSGNNTTGGQNQPLG